MLRLFRKTIVFFVIPILLVVHVNGKSDNLNILNKSKDSNIRVFNTNSNSNSNKKNSNKCFCMLNGDVDDCQCKIEAIDKFNNYKIFPRLNAIVQKDYFRYIKVNLKKICQFWPDDARCSLKGCHIKVCTDVSSIVSRLVSS